MALDSADDSMAAFPAYREADWRDAVAKALKGAPFERLRSPTLDGYTIEPLYQRSAPATGVWPARGATPWGVIQRVDHPEPDDANALALADLEGGANGLDLVFAESVRSRGYGIGASDTASIGRVLAPVELDLITLRIDAGNAASAVAGSIVDLASARGITPASLTLHAALDPIGDAARLGRGLAALESTVARAAGEAAALALSGLNGTGFSADGRIWDEAGASRSQALAAVLATAIAYWRALERQGLDLADAATRIGFVLAADQSQFSTIAEIRALRLIWGRVLEATGLDPRPAQIHVETAWRMLSRLDANTNLIRATIAGFSAGIGGADSVSVLPYCAASGLADGFARRLSRNIQTMLLEESNLFRVADPAAGSGRVEAETLALADSAWGLFQQIEAEGGIVACLAAGALQARIIAARDRRMADIARRKEPITGVSDFPVLSEPHGSVLPIAARAEPVLPDSDIPALPALRLSEPFEALRAAAATSAPRMFLANLGAIADFTVRAGWARTLFEAGGIETLSNDGFATLDDLVAAFRASGTRAACIASSDAIYADMAEPVARALKAAGAGPLYLAGKPADAAREAALRAAGVDVFVYAGLDVVAVLTDAQARIAAASGVAGSLSLPTDEVLP